MRNTTYKIAIMFIIVILYVAAARFSQFLNIPGTPVSPVWPPAGIALAAVLLYGNMALIAVFIGCFLSNIHMFITGGLTMLAILYGIIPGAGGAIQAYAGKFALARISGTCYIFKDTRSVLTFIFVSAFAACTINATCGVGSLIISGQIAMTDVFHSWLTWWISDAVGVVTITSTIMALKQGWKEKISLSQLARLAATWALILIVGYFTLHSSVQLAFLLIPFAIWAAFQFEIGLSVLTGFLISSVCLYGALQGGGLIKTAFPFASILLIQVFISIIYLTILLINTILSDRKKAYDNLQLLNLQLEKRVLDRTKDLSESNQQLQVQKNKVMEAFEALKQSHARLMQSEKMASLGMLTAGVAHEIKNPLNAMTANMEAIKRNSDQMIQSIERINIDENTKNEVVSANENTGSLITATKEGIKRTAGIIADLCAFSSSDEPEMVMSDLHRNIDSTLNLLTSELKGAHVTVIKEYGEIPLLLCHPGKINQVIMNILINASHALQGRRDNKITIKTQNKDNAIVLSLRDNGPGMKKEIVDKIFVPFFTTKQAGQGSGLGLFISSNIIKEHHGTISVVSELEKGTEFIITLPIQKE